MLLDQYGKPLKIPTGETIAAYGRLQVMEALEPFVNPDTLAREDGLISYDETVRDLHTKSVWNTRIWALRKCPLTWQPAPDEPNGQQHAEFAEWNFTQAMRRSPTAVREQVHRAASKNGYAVQEYIWQPNYPNGKFAGATALVDIKDRDPDQFLIKSDGLYLKKDWSDTVGTKAPAHKFWLATFQSEYENPYGVSLFQEARWYVWFKKQGFKFWLVFLEKFGMPTVKGVIPENYTNEAEIEKVREVLRTIRGREAITVPAGFDVSLLEATKAGSAGAGYDQLIAVCNREISKGVLGQTLTTEEGMSSGSFALSKTHGDVRDDILQADGEWYDSEFNFGPVVELIDFNFAVAGYPICVSETQPGDDLNAQADRDLKLVQAGVKIPQRYFYESYNIPAPEPGEAVAGVMPAAPLPPSGGVPRSLPFSVTPPAPTQGGVVEGFAERGKKKVAATDKFYEAALKEGAQRYAQAFIAPLRKAIDQAQSIAALKKINVKPSAAFAEYLGDVLRTAYILGRWVERQRLDAQTPAVEDFAETTLPPVQLPGGDLAATVFDAPLTNEAALEFIANKRIMTAAQYNRLAQQVKETVFHIANVEDERLLELVKGEVERALSDGITFEEFKKAVSTAFDNFGVDPLNPWHLETVFRTNIQSAYHSGSWDMLHDPDLGDLIQYLKYDAIEDDRTRPAHAALDGVTLPLDDPFWERWYPPNGYNCRCDVLPVTKYAARDHNITATPHNEIPRQVIMDGRTYQVEPDEGFDAAPTIAPH